MAISEKSRRTTGLKTGLVYALALGAALSVALVISAALAFYLYQSQVKVKRDQHAAQLAAARAQALATKADAYLRKLVAETVFAASKANLILAAQQSQGVALAQFRSSLPGEGDNITAVRFVAKGAAKVDSEPDPLPIRYAELDMIQRNERGETVYPEAILNNSVWRLLVLAPVAFGDEAGEDTARHESGIHGSLLLAFNTQGLRDFLVDDEQELLQGLIQLQQVFGRNGNDVLVMGQGGEQDFAHVVQVAGSHWHLRFTPSAALLSQIATPMMMVLAIVGIFTLVMLSVATWLSLRMARRFCELRSTRPGAVSLGELISSEPTGDHYIDPMYQKDSILDVEITEENESLMLFEDEADSAAGQDNEVSENAQKMDAQDDADRQLLAAPEVFRAYDIRGDASTLVNNKLAYALGQAVASEALDKGEDTLVVARDARNQSPGLAEFLIRGILSTGCHVLNIGTVPTPLLYFATETLDETSSGIMVTASHNPATDNGFKIVLQKQPRTPQDIKALRQRIVDGAVHHGVGQEHRLDIVERYVDAILSDVALAENFTVVIDAANAVPGILAPRLFEDLGCQVIPLYCDLNGDFPNHAPDPSNVSNLDALLDTVKKEQADIGLAFDGDGDRLAIVTASGRIVLADQLLTLFAVDILSRNPGADVVFDVKSSRHVAQLVSEAGGRPIMWKTGHSPMRHKMIETGALLGGEFSGHIFIKDRWFGFDDGIYAAARLLELLSLQDDTLDDMLDALPKSVASKEYRIAVDGQRKTQIVEALKQQGQFDQGLHTTIDGLRVDFPTGWGLVRAANTESCLSMRFEADDEQALREIKVVFDRELRRVDNSIEIEWN